jgi:hypothetical protein
MNRILDGWTGENCSQQSNDSSCRTFRESGCPILLYFIPYRPYWDSLLLFILAISFNENKRHFQRQRVCMQNAKSCHQNSALIEEELEEKHKNTAGDFLCIPLRIFKTKCRIMYLHHRMWANILNIHVIRTKKLIYVIIFHILYPEFRALLALHLCHRLTVLQEYFAQIKKAINFDCKIVC